ncbi:hypothetical protein M5K25_025989 [Dendrobium thyrsiflorum]|uniref:Uncharacterized protein n=1 Tax=Dendrobium thyrsiflorum TaxID=117978 RepID=A0ABD0TW33_DENTH
MANNPEDWQNVMQQLATLQAQMNEIANTLANLNFVLSIYGKHAYNNVMRTSAGDFDVFIIGGILISSTKSFTSKDQTCKPASPPCMADLEHDHGFIYDFQERVDLLQSPFFDLNLEVDDTVDDYVDRILFTLVPSIEEHQPSGQWRIIGRPPTSSPPATSPASNTVGISYLLVASLGRERGKDKDRKGQYRDATTQENFTPRKKSRSTALHIS